MVTHQQALELATKAHTGQFRKDGITPYIKHPIAVADMMSTDEEKIVAILHDVVEDTDFTIYEVGGEAIKEYWLDNSMVLPNKVQLTDIIKNALVLLTHGLDESYEEYIQKIADSGNLLAFKVKIADMTCNLLDNPSEKQAKKYRAAIKQLLEAL